jgi:hypothetical protein
MGKLAVGAFKAFGIPNYLPEQRLPHSGQIYQVNGSARSQGDVFDQCVLFNGAESVTREYCNIHIALGFQHATRSRAKHQGELDVWLLGKQVRKLAKHERIIVLICITREALR